MRRTGALLLALLIGAQAAGADAPERSLWPMARPDTPPAEPARRTETRAQDTAIPVSPLPVTRPAGAAPAPRTEVTAPQAEVRLVASPSAVRISPRPGARPANLRRRSVVGASGMGAVRQPPPPTRSGGVTAVCGDASIIGQTVAPIPGRIAGCGVANPVRVQSVSGVALSQGAILDCGTARALKTWIDGTVKPTVGRLGGGVQSLRVAAHYSCRTRNNQPGARISEHGRGKAIDISAINLRNGQAITVLRGWRDASVGPVMKRLHAGACGPFGTVLGPNSDRFHQDHFHFDTARHGNGPYCR